MSAYLCVIIILCSCQIRFEPATPAYNLDATLGAGLLLLMPTYWTKKKSNILCVTLVGKTGFEPATPWSQTRCATGLRYFPNYFVKTNIICLYYQTNLAVREGFEPSVQSYPYGSLANY